MERQGISEQQLNETFQKNWEDLHQTQNYSPIRLIRAWSFTERREHGVPGGWMALGEMKGAFALFFVDKDFYQHSLLPMEEGEERKALHHANAIGYILAGLIQPL